ncbi:MAG: SIR2 family protein [Firmicutes bacterium]|nr:SIR2 family protein [Bacillota bacterium]
MAKIYDSLVRKELETFINAVTEKILQNELSLFIGAGSSIQYGFMSWEKLINKICISNNLPQSSDGWSNTDLAQCAELEGVDVKWNVCNTINNVRFDISNKNTFLNHLLDFDYKSIWTTNYDCIIEEILKNKAKDCSAVYRYEHFRSLSYLGGLFLFKINGSSVSPESIVITHEQFINYRRSHEAYLILLKRELLCHTFLFLGCSFNDDILRSCVKDILNCIDNSGENYATKHYAVIAEENHERLSYICNDLSIHYSINCLKVSKPAMSHKITQGIASKVKFNTIFISGAKMFTRYSSEETYGKKVCQTLVSTFLSIDTMPFKFVSGMGMSIGHFISGSIKQNIKNRDINRFLDMEPFPFSSKSDNDKHRTNIMLKAGIFIFLYGDMSTNVESSGMWKEYQIAKRNKDSIIIPLPCGEDSISNLIFNEEYKNCKSFVYENIDLFKSFSIYNDNLAFFRSLVNTVIIETRKKWI